MPPANRLIHLQIVHLLISFLLLVASVKSISNLPLFMRAMGVSQTPMIHPFREGNGRTQRMYIEQLCQNNGRFEIDFTEATKEEMILASVQSANVSNDLLEALIYKCLVELVN